MNATPERRFTINGEPLPEGADFSIIASHKGTAVFLDGRVLPADTEIHCDGELIAVVTAGSDPRERGSVYALLGGRFHTSNFRRF